MSSKDPRSDGRVLYIPKSRLMRRAKWVDATLSRRSLLAGGSDSKVFRER